MIRLGLCCQFKEAPIKFYTTTAAYLSRLEKKAAALKLSDLCKKNAQSLEQALLYCAENGIGSFRVNSQILPLKTHPVLEYQLQDIPDGGDIIKSFEKCRSIIETHRLRASFHPDQFILLSSPREDVTERAVADLIYQAEVSEWIGADVINIHGGGAYGDKDSALSRVRENIRTLPDLVRSRLTLENDDKTYTPQDLFPVCHDTQIPLVYDVHHHRCLADDLTVEQATTQALATWNREPMFHISSPKDGWQGAQPSRHHDYIDSADFPECWYGFTLTVEVEAKAKELAVKHLAQAIEKSTLNKRMK